MTYLEERQRPGSKRHASKARTREQPCLNPVYCGRKRRNCIVKPKDFGEYTLKREVLPGKHSRRLFRPSYEAANCAILSAVKENSTTERALELM